MIPTDYRFITPLDVLFLRGNKLFGAPGSYGESLIPPWPSVAAGALRSRILVEDKVDLQAFAENRLPHPSLGTPMDPGSFTLTAFHLARRYMDGRVEMLMPLPADLVISRDLQEALQLQRLVPTALESAGIQHAFPLPLCPVLPAPQRNKSLSGYWLTETGWHQHLSGARIDHAHLVPQGHLWRLEDRVGIGLDPQQRSAAEGKLFTMQAVSLLQRGHALDPLHPTVVGDYDVGFVVGVTGATLPRSGTLRLGGDGRGAQISGMEHTPSEPDYAGMVQQKRARIVLTSPGIFDAGWLPNGVRKTDQGDYILALEGVRGRLVCAAVSRSEVVSGWDVARRQPKTAQRVAPSGSVYWIDDLQAQPEALRKITTAGLWDPDSDNPSRRAEGFNRFTWAAW
ncbi:MAG: type III-B CRISPR module-associated Cmr3 family protein [Acidithiobacillus sp.]